jgi:hypothetical protein
VWSTLRSKLLNGTPVFKILVQTSVSVADNWKENPDFSLYLSKLGSFGVEQLSKCVIF